MHATDSTDEYLPSLEDLIESVLKSCGRIVSHPDATRQDIQRCIQIMQEVEHLHDKEPPQSEKDQD